MQGKLGKVKGKVSGGVELSFWLSFSPLEYRYSSAFEYENSPNIYKNRVKLGWAKSCYFVSVLPFRRLLREEPLHGARPGQTAMKAHPPDLLVES